MSDIADQTDSTIDLMLRSAQFAHSQKMATLEQVTECIHCEENPAKIMPNGLKLKYCQRCIDELALTNL